MFLEFDCGHFETKMESLRPFYQKLVFCPYLGMGVAWSSFPHSNFGQLYQKFTRILYSIR